MVGDCLGLSWPRAAKWARRYANRSRTGGSVLALAYAFLSDPAAVWTARRETLDYWHRRESPSAEWRKSEARWPAYSSPATPRYASSGTGFTGTCAVNVPASAWRMSRARATRPATLVSQ